MRITDEAQLLDPVVRARIIEEIENPENKRRKHEHYKRYQCYKDKTYLYVIKQLLRQFDASTVNEMSYAISNVAIVRKAIDKLARVYKYGVERESPEAQDAIDTLSREININAQMKKANRFFKLHKNTAFYVCPKKVDLGVDSKKTIKACPLPPFLYDVVEMDEDRENPAAYILSDYEQEDVAGLYHSLNPSVAQRTQRSVVGVRQGDGVDQIIADTPADQGLGREGKQYVFWSKSFHFTCNEKGEILSEDINNPIQQLPFVNFAEDQDGSFWAEGGDDLTDGAILVNAMISNVNHIGITQGYGQLVMTGKNLPRNQKVGPNKAVLLEFDSQAGETAPTFDFKTANPPLDQLRGLIEMYTALILTTNNLSTSGVSSKLDSSMQFPSGIAMLLDKAESMEDIEDQRQIFIDNEPLVWQLIAKWHEVLKNTRELTDDLMSVTFPKEFDVSLKFNRPTVIQSEREKLDVLKMKKEMGMIGMIDLLRAEYPDMTDEELAAKLEELMAEAMERAKRVIGQSTGNENDEERNIEQDRDRDPDMGEPGGEDPDQTGRGRISRRTNPA